MGVGSGMEGKEGGKGALVGTIIIVILLVVAGAYVWMTKDATTSVIDQSILNAPDSATNALNQQSSSDEMNAIEADVSATNLNDLNSDFGNIDAELNAVQ
jgi:hypothetical protein